VFVPELLTSLKTYNREKFFADAIAGLIVGIVALPLAIAFAIASGLTPERGLYTAIIAGFLISALGGSRVQIGGPTGAFVVIVYGIVQQHGVDGLLIATLMAGVILVAMGIAKLGAAIKFIPYPVTVGFTAGIAVIIFSSQIKDFFGLQMGDVPAEFIAKWRLYGESLPALNLTALGVGAGSLLLIMLWPRISHRIPGPFVALFLSSLVVAVFNLPVETIGSRFGEIHAGLPAPVFPNVSIAVISELIAPAFAIATLAAIESLLSAVVADGMIGGRHRSNMELVAQGVANIASPLFGGMPATGAIARTATNVKNGGRTPVAGMIHAVVLLLITLFFGRLAGSIPLATLAAILIVVAYHMSEWRAFRSILRAPRSDVLVLFATFLLTVLVDLTVAIQVGMVLAALLFMKRMADVTNISSITGSLEDAAVPSGDESGAVYRRQVAAGVEVYEINGPFFFGAAEAFRNALAQVASPPRVLVIRMRNVPTIDATGMQSLRTVVTQAQKDGTRVILAEITDQPRLALLRSGLLGEHGGIGMATTLDEALLMAVD
jgi:SulP family sulfate permease